MYQFGAGKQNGDGLGTTNGAQTWQSATTTNSNQSGTNTTGAGQIAGTTTYFAVIKYTFGTTTLLGQPGSPNAGVNTNQKDTVSIWINPVNSTLGDDAGEAIAGGAGGSYYSAINGYAGTTNIDAGTIQSFLLNGHAQTTQGTTALMTIDELRIGTSWSDVTPTVPEPASLGALGLGAGALLARRRRQR